MFKHPLCNEECLLTVQMAHVTLPYQILRHVPVRYNKSYCQICFSCIHRSHQSIMSSRGRRQRQLYSVGAPTIYACDLNIVENYQTPALPHLFYHTRPKLPVPVGTKIKPLTLTELQVKTMVEHLPRLSEELCLFLPTRVATRLPD
jgi:hypothetical protein